MKKQNIIILAVLSVVFFSAMNLFFMMMTSSDDSRETIEQQVVFKPATAVKSRKVSGKLTRRMYLAPNRNFSMNIIFLDEKEMARFKSNGEKIFDVEGEIPDGKIKFNNVTTGTYGTESFDRGKRVGAYREYFSDGQLRFEKNYFYGKISNLKEFYPSGQVRMEIDYSDALWLADEDEVGDGKIFFNDGVLMYEWHLTANDPNRYKKMYNYTGELVETHFFDGKGNLISKKRVARE